MRRFIKSQGDLDGACFLYTVVNAAQTLTNRAIRKKEWRLLVESSATPLAFLNGSGTALIDERERLLQEIISTSLELIGCPTRVAVQYIENGKFPKGIGIESVLILDDGNHWYCIVEANKERVYAACSAEWQSSPNKYKEDTSPRNRKIYNRTILCSELTYFRGRAFLVSRAHT